MKGGGPGRLVGGTNYLKKENAKYLQFSPVFYK